MINDAATARPVNPFNARPNKFGFAAKLQSAYNRGQIHIGAVGGRYHLYVSLACPWSHRTVIVRAVKGLGEAVGISYAAPFRDERGWAFTGERFVEPATGLTDEYADKSTASLC